MAEDVGFAVTITAKDIYDKLIAQGELLMSLHSRLDNMGQNHDQHSERIDDHEVRLRELEAFKWKIVGFSSLIGAVVATAMTIISKFI
jgi:hypothetical protein